MKYAHALLLNCEYGILDGIMPDALTRCPSLLKANKDNPDNPTLSEALSGPYKEEFLKAMKLEIEELETHNTWTIVPRSTVPEEKTVLPGTWAMKIKRYPDGRLRKFKARFCTRGDKQIEGIHYTDKYAPVVAWSMVMMML